MADIPPRPPRPEACVSCRLSGEPCAQPALRGAVTGLQKEADAWILRVRDEGGAESRVRLAPADLTGSQSALLDRLRPRGGTLPSVGLLHLAGGAEEWRFTRHSLLVLEPDWLFSVSDATHFEFCERQRLVSFFRADTPGLPLIRGTVVHELFPLIWRGAGEDEVEAALARLLEGQALKIGLAGLEPGQVAADARLHANRLRRWAAGMSRQSQLVSETFRLVPELGLKGRIDAVWEQPGKGPVILGELKTGKSRGRLAARAQAESGEAELGHLFQLVSYAAMLMARNEVRANPLHACLLYSGNPDAGGKPDILRRVEVTIGRLRDAVDIRNRLVLLEQGEPPAFHDRPNACARCRDNAACERVSGLSGHGGPRARAPADGTDPADAACFRHYAGLVRAELAAVRVSVSRLWKMTPEARAAEGTAARLEGPGRPEPPPEDGEGRAVRRFAVAGGNRSEFRAGDTVLISDAAGPAGGRCALGTVAAAGPRDLALAWEAEPGLEPAWVDAYPDEKLTRRQLAALYRFLARPSRLKDVLVRGRRAPEWEADGPEAPSAAGDRLNPRQREAISAALRARDVQLIAGPPGSGKTTLIGALVEAMLRRPGRPRVLLVAATNRALDQALEKAAGLEAAGFPVVRLGGDGTASERVRPLTLAARLKACGSAEEAAAAVKALVDGARLAGVTASTLAGGSLDLVLGDFEWVVVDEASQMTVPLGLGAASWGRRLVLIGDDRQLPPVVRAEGGAGGEWPGLSVSLFELVRERLAGKGPVLVELERQYRMSEGVGSAPAAVWYGGRLNPGHPAVAARRLEGVEKWEKHPLAAALDPGRPVLVVDLPGEAGPRVHGGEAAWVTAFVEGLEACGATATAPEAGRGVELAVISPYRAQVARIRTALGARFPAREALWRLCVDTVDRFQGGEADVVLVSLCPPDGPSEHLADPRRLNVALTRARSKVILLGDCGRLERYPVFQRLFQEYERRWPGAWRLGRGHP